MSVCAYHDSTPDQNPKQDVSCVGASLKITLKISRILQAESCLLWWYCMLVMPRGVSCPDKTYVGASL